MSGAPRAPVLRLALVVAAAALLAPVLPEPARAATGGLLTHADAVYELDPDRGAVHVAVTFTLTNDKPGDGAYDYAFRDLSWPIHPEATNVRALDAHGALRVVAAIEDGYIRAAVRLRRDLRYGATTEVGLLWDLPGGAPRSDSGIRVGDAFAAFQLWAWGDPGEAAVRAEIPAGYRAQVTGSDVEVWERLDATRIAAEAIPDPDDFFVSVTAIRAQSYRAQMLGLPGDVAFRILSWPEDPLWRRTVADTLEENLPKLRELVGLPWPVEERLDITEVYAPLLEGYAGLFYMLEERIEISEDLDAETIVHEASHAWFNDALFLDRWIVEGLAETYSTRVLSGTDGILRRPERPRASDPGRVDLAAWTFPETIDDESARRDEYGYNASWYLVDALVREIGPDRMRAVFLAADRNEIAYVGAGAPETVAAGDSWRRFLDLLVEIGGSTQAEDLFRDLVAPPAASRELDARETARARYAALLETGGDWRPPLWIRASLGNWSFPRAIDRIAEATEVLELRDRVDVLAEALDLTPDDAFETAYETADVELDTAEAAGQAQLGALHAIDRAAAAVAAEPDPVEWIGLLGADPAVLLDAAGSAFEAGDLYGAGAIATDAAAIVARAGVVGGERLAIAALGTGVVVLFAVAILAGRRRQAARMSFAAGRREGSPGASEVAAASEPYATLADHRAGRPPGADGAAGAQGGVDDGGVSRSALLGRGRPRPLMPIHRTRPSWEILSGDSADVYFARAERILEREGLDPVVTMEVFTRQEAILCGIDEAKNLLAHVLAEADVATTVVEALDDGDEIVPREVVLRITARYRAFGLYETAILGMLAQSTGWATAAREIVRAAAPEPVISFGARHVHPDITDVLDYAAIVGGCVGASTPAGARLAGLNPTGTMPHALVLIFGDTVDAALAFDRDLEPDIPRIVLVDTFKDEAEEALRVAEALGDRLYGIRLDTPSERGRVTPDLVHEVRARLDMAGHREVKIVASGGLTPDRIRFFKEAGAPVDSFAVGSYISGARPIDFTGDLKEIDGRPIAKRGRIPGRTSSPRLKPVRLADWLEAGSG